MFKRLPSESLNMIDKMMQWVDPYWWLCVALALFVLCVIHFFPLELKEENVHFTDRVLVYVRRFFLISLVGLVGIFPIVFYLTFGLATIPSQKIQASLLVKEWYWDMLLSYWSLIAAAGVSGVVINFCWHRYGEPYISSLKRKYRVTQKVDLQSDVRNDILEFKSKKFDPEKYFKPDSYFMGLDMEDEPVYVPAEVLEATQTITIGPTGFGKGVDNAVVLTQAVRRGNTVFCVDPKGDKRIPFVLQNEAKKAGRPFVFLDLNPGGKGSWQPFKGGSLRDRRSRILAAFRLGASGTNADVYKTKERSIVDKILKSTDGSISAMFEAATQLTLKDDLSELREGLAEWAQISTFTSSRKRKGHSIETSILNNAVVYVRGSLNDSVINAATRCYVSELVQFILSTPQRETHVTLLVDETRFVISKEIVDALATIREFKANMFLATQAITDLRNLEDKSIDGAALQKSVEINCQVKKIMRAGDEDTAEWASGLSGTKQVRAAGNERTEVNRWGGEKWEAQRSFNMVEVPLFHKNVFLVALPPMVSILYQPGALPCPTFSSWLTVDQSYASWEKKELEEVDDPEATTVTVAAAAVPKAAIQAVNAGVSQQPNSKPNGPSAPPAAGASPAKPKARGNPNLAAKKLSSASAPMVTGSVDLAPTPAEPMQTEPELTAPPALAAVDPNSNANNESAP